MSEAAGKCVPAVTHAAGLELNNTNMMSDNIQTLKGCILKGVGKKTAADPIKMVLFEQPLDEGLGPLLCHFGAITQHMVRDEAERKNNGGQTHPCSILLC